MLQKFIAVETSVTTRKGCGLVEVLGGRHGNSRGKGSNQDCRKAELYDSFQSTAVIHPTPGLAGNRPSTEREGGRERGRETDR